MDKIALSVSVGEKEEIYTFMVTPEENERILNGDQALLQQMMTGGVFKRSTATSHLLVANSNSYQDLEDFETTKSQNEHKEDNDGKEIYAWPNKAVMLFLKIYSEKADEFTAGIKRRNKLWSEIAFELQNSNYDVSGMQVQNKMSSLKRTYKKLKDSNTKSSKQKKRWPFYLTMDSIFGDETSVSPPNVASGDRTGTFSPCHSPLSIQNNSEYQESFPKTRQRKLVDYSISHLQNDRNKLKEKINIERLVREKEIQQRAEIKQKERKEIRKEGNNEREMFIWPDKAVISFLEIYREREHEFTSGLKRYDKLWSEIALELQELNYDISGVQAQNKMSSLKRTYKKIRDSNAKSGKQNSSWPFYYTMDLIFGDDPSVSPPNVASSDGPATLSTFLSSSSCHSPLSIQNNSEYQESSKSKKRKLEMTSDSSISHLQNDENQLQETRNTERLERGKEKQQRSEIKLEEEEEEREMHKEGSNEREIFTWPDKAVMLFLEIFRERKDEFAARIKRHNKLWSEIAFKLQKSNYDVSGMQVQNKMSGLKRTYKKIKDANAKSGNQNSCWPFYFTMDSIFGEETLVSPIDVESTDRPATPSTFSSSLTCHSELSIQDNSEYQNPSSKPKKKKVETILNSFISELKNHRDQIKEERNRERLEREERRQQRWKVEQEDRKKMHKEISEMQKSLVDVLNKILEKLNEQK